MSTTQQPMSGSLIESLISTVEKIENRSELICLCEDAEIFAEPSPALVDAETKFWEGR